MQIRFNGMNPGSCQHHPGQASSHPDRRPGDPATFAGVAKAIFMQFHTANTGDTAGVAFAYMDLFRVF